MQRARLQKKINSTSRKVAQLIGEKSEFVFGTSSQPKKNEIDVSSKFNKKLKLSEEDRPDQYTSDSRNIIINMTLLSTIVRPFA